MSDPAALNLDNYIPYFQSYINSIRKAYGQERLRLEAFDQYKNPDGTFRLYDMLHDPNIVAGGLSEDFQIKLVEYINHHAGLHLGLWDTTPYENPTAAQAIADQAIQQLQDGTLDHTNLPMPDGQRIVVVLDPGHGDRVGLTAIFEPGAAIVMPDGTILNEPDFIDPVARALQQELAARGIEVVFTRFPYEHPLDSRAFYNVEGQPVNDKGEFLDWRIVITNALIKEGYTPVFISIHADQANMKGSTVYFPPNSPLSAELAVAINGSYTLDPTNAHPPVLDTYHVINGQFNWIAAALIEIANIDDPQERAFVMNNPNVLAARISDGIEQFIETAYPGRERVSASLNIEPREAQYAAVVGTPVTTYAEMLPPPQPTAVDAVSATIAFGLAALGKGGRGA